MIEEKINEDEWALSQVLAHPVLFREFLNEDDPNWKPLENHERAWSTSTKNWVSMCCGRSVHKTTSMIEMLYWWMINKKFVPGDPGLFVLVPNKAQKELSFTKVHAACLSNWLIRHFTKSVNVMDGRIDFLNGFQFLLRIAGESGKESNVIGVHTYRIWVDEAQDIPWRTWLSLQNCLKQEMEHYQMIVSGVPNGGRQDNVLYYTDQMDEKYSKYNIPQTSMSWWTPEMEYDKRKQYHALQEDSEDYKHYVLGQHGAPTFNVFDRARFEQADYDPQKIILTQHMLETYKRADRDGKVRYHIEEAVICPPVPSEYGSTPLVGLGYDVGFSPDPAVFFIMYQDSKTGKWRNLVRFVLERVEYALQREVLAWLDKVYNFSFIGIDMGGPGKVQYQDLTSDLSAYENEFHFRERIYPVEFGAQILVAYDEIGNEKKDLVKRVAVETLVRWVYEKRFQFSSDDDDLMSELERTKFTRTITGEPIYKTEDDHQMAAFMCAILAYENKFGIPVARSELQIKLAPAHWFDAYKYD